MVIMRGRLSNGARRSRSGTRGALPGDGRLKRDLLFVTRNFPPLGGGMERLCAEALAALVPAWTVTLVGPRGCESAVAEAVGACGVESAPARRFLVQASLAARRLARQRCPALVLAGSGVAALPAWLAARVCDARLAVLVHGMDVAYRGLAYRALALPALRRADLVIANSRFTARLAEACGVAPGRVRILHPGVTLPAALPARIDARPPTLLYAGRLIRRKGLAEFVRHALPRLVAEVPDLRLLIAGDRPRAALAGGEDERARLEAALAETGLRAHLDDRGWLDDAGLAEVYAAADALLFPIADLPGDVEGFGMVAVEAAAHGVPTIAFAAGGAPDSVADGVSGVLVAPGDWDAFADACLRVLRGGLPGVDAASCRAHAERFAWPRYGEQLRALLAAV